VTICVNGASDSFGRIYPVQLVRIGFPTGSHGTIWYTALGIAGFLIGIVALYVVGRRIHSDTGAKSTMIVVCGLGAGSVALLAFAPDLQWAVVAILVATGIASPLIRTVTTLWVNRRTTDEVRAITHSFFAQAEYVGEICVAGTLTAVPATGGVVASLIAAAALFAASALIVTRAGSRTPVAPDNGELLHRRWLHHPFGQPGLQVLEFGVFHDRVVDYAVLQLQQDVKGLAVGRFGRGVADSLGRLVGNGREQPADAFLGIRDMLGPDLGTQRRDWHC
jgi:MFS family permease